MILNILFSLLLAISAEAKTKALWTEWYILSVNGKTVGYFQEIAEESDKQVTVTQRWKEKEAIGTSETFIGSVAENNKTLTPIAFFSERKSSGEVYKVDGKMIAGAFSIAIRNERPKLKNEKKKVAIKERAFLSNLIPMALSRAVGKSETFSFQAIVEDARDGVYQLRPGVAKVQGVKKTIKGNECRQYEIEFNGMVGDWWIDGKGKLCSLHIPSSQSKLELATEVEAKKAFEN